MKENEVAALIRGIAPGIGQWVLDAVDKPLRAFSERLKAVETRVPERGEKGDHGIDGKDGAAGANGKDGRDGVDGKDGAAGEMGQVGPAGPQGLIGEKGDPGRDGRDAADLAMLRKDIAHMIVVTITEIFKAATFTSPDAGRTLQITLAGTLHEIKTATMLDRGVWREGAYQRGDTVSFGGSMWVAQQDTDTKPETPQCDWRLSVKRGRDGKDGKPGERGLPGPRGDSVEQRRMNQ